MTVSPGIAASYRRALARAGIPVTVQRIDGVAPHASSIFANVTAIVRDYQPDMRAEARTGIGASAMGALTQADRTVILLAADLEAQRFPLPVKKNDKITLGPTGAVLTITEVDAFKLAAAGAIEARAAGVA